MQLLQLTILLRLFLNSHLIPFLDNLILSLIEIHELVAHNTLAFLAIISHLLELSQSVIDLSTLVFSEE